MSGPRAYEVLLASEAESACLVVTSRADLAKADSMPGVLDVVPGIGRSYDLLYEAARPDVESLLVAYAGHFGIYYVADEDARRVAVLAIEDRRRAPMVRVPRSCSFPGSISAPDA